MFKFCFFERITIFVITAGHIENFPRWEHLAGAIDTPGIYVQVFGSTRRRDINAGA